MRKPIIKKSIKNMTSYPRIIPKHLRKIEKWTTNKYVNKPTYYKNP